MKTKTKTTISKKVSLLNPNHQTGDDFRNSLLIVSLFGNLFIFTTWLLLEVTNDFNGQIIAYLQG